MSEQSLAKSRAEALNNGLDYFVSVRPCKRSGAVIRATNGSRCVCVACKRHRSILSLAYQKANPEGARQRARKWQAENPEKVAVMREAGKDLRKELGRRWRRENHGLVLYRNAMRRKAVKRATPPWADKDAIRAIYEECARLRREGHDVHVDHIMPLRGVNMSGLHVHWNLQILPAKENLSKGNRVQFAAEADTIADERNQCIASYNALRATP